MVNSGMTLSSVTLLLCLTSVIAPPPRRPPVAEHAPQHEENLDINSETMGLEYKNYLEEVVKLLENDDKFKKILENATDADIKSGAVADKLHVVDPHIRSKLDEVKRLELDRLRKHATEQFELSRGLDRETIKEPLHLEHHNPHTFREEDLRKLVKATAKDLADLDKRRRTEFKKHEMGKEFEYRKELKTMDEEHKKEAIKKHEQEKAKAKQHEKVHHPLSEDQLEEVWEEQDHMSKDSFDPETFFRMHDVDGNEVLDATEVMALFKSELDKIYNGTDYDPEEREEEMEEMREAAYEEADTDKDGLISLQEFLDSSMHEDFKHDQGWEAIPDREVFNSEEFDEFSHEQMEDMDKHTPDRAQTLHPEAPHEQALNQQQTAAPAAGQPAAQPAPVQPAAAAQH